MAVNVNNSECNGFYNTSDGGAVIPTPNNRSDVEVWSSTKTYYQWDKVWHPVSYNNEYSWREFELYGTTNSFNQDPDAYTNVWRQSCGCIKTQSGSDFNINLECLEYTTTSTTTTTTTIPPTTAAPDGLGGQLLSDTEGSCDFFFDSSGNTITNPSQRDDLWQSSVQYTADDEIWSLEMGYWKKFKATSNHTSTASNKPGESGAPWAMVCYCIWQDNEAKTNCDNPTTTTSTTAPPSDPTTPPPSDPTTTSTTPEPSSTDDADTICAGFYDNQDNAITNPTGRSDLWTVSTSYSLNTEVWSLDGGVWKKFKVIDAHTSTASNKPGESGANTYWEQVCYCYSASGTLSTDCTNQTVGTTAEPDPTTTSTTTSTTSTTPASNNGHICAGFYDNQDNIITNPTGRNDIWETGQNYSVNDEVWSIDSNLWKKYKALQANSSTASNKPGESGTSSIWEAVCYCRSSGGSLLTDCDGNTTTTSTTSTTEDPNAHFCSPLFNANGSPITSPSNVVVWNSYTTYSAGDGVWHLDVYDNWIRYQAKSTLNLDPSDRANLNKEPDSSPNYWEEVCRCSYDSANQELTTDCVDSTTTTEEPTGTNPPPTTTTSEPAGTNPPGGQGDPHIQPFFGKSYTI